MRWGMRCTIVIVLSISPAFAWGETPSWREAVAITCPLCGTDNDQQTWDTRSVLRCTTCGVPLRYPQPLTFSERMERRLAHWCVSLGEWHGSLETEGNAYAERGPRADGFIRLRLQWKRDVMGLRSFIDGFAVADSRPGIVGVERFPARHPAAIGFREAFVDASIAETDVRVGKQVWSWGKADLVHLVDVLNPEDRTRLFREERIGSWGITATRRFGETDVDVVALPRVSPTLLPDAENRFAIAPFFTDAVDLDPLRSMGALRLLRRDADVDWSLIVAHGAELMPSARFVSPFLPPQLFYPSRTLFGATAETIVGDVGLRSEVVYVAPDSMETDRRVAAVIGCDWSRNDFWAPRDRLYVNVEATTEHVFAESDAVEFPRPMTRTLAMKIEYERDAWLPSLVVVHSFDREGTRPALSGGDTYLEGALRWERTDHDDVEVRIVAPVGPRDSFFGAEEQNRSLTLSWQWKF